MCSSLHRHDNTTTRGYVEWLRRRADQRMLSTSRAVPESSELWIETSSSILDQSLNTRIVEPDEASLDDEASLMTMHGPQDSEMTKWVPLVHTCCLAGDP